MTATPAASCGPAPKAGFGAEIHDGGPGSVEVRFASASNESRIKVAGSDGQPMAEVRDD